MITITREPAAIEPAWIYGGINFEVESDVVGQPEIEVRAELYISKSPSPYNWQRVGAKQTKKFIGQDYFKFNFASYLQTELSEKTTDLKNVDVSFSNTDCRVWYKIEFQEYYYDSDGFVVGYDTATSGVFAAFNGAFQIWEKTGAGTQEYVMGDSSKKFLTDSPREVVLGIKETYELHFLCEQFWRAQILVTDKNGVQTEYLNSIGADFSNYPTDGGNGTWNYPQWTFTSVDAGGGNSVIMNSSIDSIVTEEIGSVIEDLEIEMEITAPKATLIVEKMIDGVWVEAYHKGWTGVSASFELIVISQGTPYGIGQFVDWTGTERVRFRMDDFGGTGNVFDIEGIVFTFDGIRQAPTGAQNQLYYILNLGNFMTMETDFAEVKLIDLSNNALSETFKFKADKTNHCDTVRVRWKNTKGGYDSYTFIGAKRAKKKVKKGVYRSEIGDGFSVSDKFIKTLSSNSSQRVKCYSRFETVENLEWLSELWDSQDVYWIKEDGTRLAIHVRNDGYYEHSEEPIQVELEFELSVARNIQTG